MGSVTVNNWGVNGENFISGNPDSLDSNFLYVIWNPINGKTLYIHNYKKGADLSEFDLELPEEVKNKIQEATK